MDWDKTTDIVLIASIVCLAVFFCLGIYQWVKRKSPSKVDKGLRWMPLPMILMAIVYVLFDKFLVLNTRPDGSGEPSFPSTHVMVVTTIFLCIALYLPKFLNSKLACIILDILMLSLIIFVSFGRVLANKHWTSDVLGALGFSFVFALIYYLIIRRKKKNV